MHGVATKELEYVQGYGDSWDSYAPVYGYTPEDMCMSDAEDISPSDARRNTSEDDDMRTDANSRS